jgi:hypothetical protein
MITALELENEQLREDIADGSEQMLRFNALMKENQDLEKQVKEKRYWIDQKVDSVETESVSEDSTDGYVPIAYKDMLDMLPRDNIDLHTFNSPCDNTVDYHFDEMSY